MDVKEEALRTDYEEYSDIFISPALVENITNIMFQNEETMQLSDSSTNNTETTTPQCLPQGPPERTIFPGYYNFTVSVAKSKKTYYSEHQNRIFVKYKSSFALEFKWAFDRAAFDMPNSNMYVRATLLYSDEQNWQKRVNRCIQHQHPDEPPLQYHILRSDLTSDVVTYTGNAWQDDSWYSVVVEYPHPPPNSASRSHSYNMACKNSCSSGINRRNTEIFFTLENSRGRVFGRQSVGIRTCACPKRDMHKEESVPEQPKTKRPMKPSHTPPPTKRIMTVNSHDPDNDKIIAIPPELEVIGADVLTTGFGVMINMMKIKAEKGDPATKEKCEKSISKINAFLKPYEKE